MKKDFVKKKILIFSEYYLPGYKSGGGMRTIVNIVSNLSDKFDFYIVTKDLDGKSDKIPYPNVKYHEWNEVGDAKVYYLNKKHINISKIYEIFSDVKPDILYSNSYFSVFGRYLLLLNSLNRLNNTPYIVSPCGELSEDSFKMGRVKKRTFVNTAKVLGLHKNIIWKASTDVEKAQIEKILGRKEQIRIAPDLIPKVFIDESELPEKPHKTSGSAKMIFLSRFNQKKNFKFLLEVISNIKGHIELDMIGPVDDYKYFDECLAIMDKLSKNIKVSIKDSVPHNEVVKTLGSYHFFVLPTRHENFGHIFLEAFSAGCPIIISDRTPWLNLEKQKIGWDIPLENPALWKEILQRCVDMGQSEYTKLSDHTKTFVQNWMKENDLETETENLFDYALSKT